MRKSKAVTRPRVFWRVDPQNTCSCSQLSYFLPDFWIHTIPRHIDCSHDIFHHRPFHSEMRSLTAPYNAGKKRGERWRSSPKWRCQILHLYHQRVSLSEPAWGQKWDGRVGGIIAKKLSSKRLQQHYTRYNTIFDTTTELNLCFTVAVLQTAPIDATIMSGGQFTINANSRKFVNYRSQIYFFNTKKSTFTLKLFQKVAKKYARRYHFYDTFSTEFECNFYKKFRS